MKSKIGMKVTTQQYDIESMPIERVSRLWYIWKLFPYGISGIGPFIKQFIMLNIHHRFGYFIAKTKMRRELKKQAG